MHGCVRICGCQRGAHAGSQMVKFTIRAARPKAAPADSTVHEASFQSLKTDGPESEYSAVDAVLICCAHLFSRGRSTDHGALPRCVPRPFARAAPAAPRPRCTGGSGRSMRGMGGRLAAKLAGSGTIASAASSDAPDDAPDTAGGVTTMARTLASSERRCASAQSTSSRSKSVLSKIDSPLARLYTLLESPQAAPARRAARASELSGLSLDLSIRRGCTLEIRRGGPRLHGASHAW